MGEDTIKSTGDRWEGAIAMVGVNRLLWKRPETDRRQLWRPRRYSTAEPAHGDYVHTITGTA